MAPPQTLESADPIVVAVDASPHSLAALRAAAELAATLRVELHGIFVEDINLLHVCGLPFSQEVGSYSASVRRLDTFTMERQFRVLATHIRDDMARIAGQAQVPWSFEVARGSVASVILAASEQAGLLSLGRVGRSRGKLLGSTVRSVVRSASRPLLVLDNEGQLRYPLRVVYTGSSASKRGLALALQLARPRHQPVVLLAASGVDPDAGEVRAWREEVVSLIGEQALAAYWVEAADEADLLRRVREQRRGTLIVPITHAHLLAEMSESAILTP